MILWRTFRKNSLGFRNDGREGALGNALSYYTSHCLSQRRARQCGRGFSEYDLETLGMPAAIVKKTIHWVSAGGSWLDAEAVPSPTVF